MQTPTIPRQNITFSSSEIPDDSLSAGLNRLVGESLRPVSAGGAVLYTVCAISRWLVPDPQPLPAGIRIWLAGCAALTALAFAGIYFYQRRSLLPHQWAHPLAAGMVGLVLANSLLQLALTGAAGLTSASLTLVLLVVGSGFLFLLDPMVGSSTGGRLVELGGRNLGHADPGAFAVLAGMGILGGGLLASALLAVLVHTAHLRQMRRLQKLLIQNARYKLDFETVLVSTEDAQRSLATSMAVGQRIVSILDLNVLLNQVASLIHERFHCYFVGIFLLDENDPTYIVARAGTGEAGSHLVHQGLRLKVGGEVDSGEGLIGWVAAYRRAALVSDVLQDPRYVATEALPETRAELALPLEMGQSLLGVLDMESEKLYAFREEDVPYLQMLADQVAIAIQNARLYDEINHLNRDLESLVGQRTEALQTAYNQLERLDRTKSDFISISSHELRTPLTLMRGYSQMLLDEREINQNDYLKQMVNGIQAGAIRLHEIVDSMLDVAKIDNRVLELQLGPVSIPTLLKYIHEGQKEALDQRTLTLTMDFEELPQIEADQEGLQKVFTNLVVNAIKFTPDGGMITITGRVLPPGSYELGEGGVEVIVSDTGIGIDPSAQVLIFRKFYQIGEVSLHSSGKTKFKGGGPGLGLAIAKGVVDAHGGLIWVESPGHDEQAYPGSHFHVVLPKHPAVKKLGHAG